jgi:tetratricopeptide (TPR) repeat protein
MHPAHPATRLAAAIPVLAIMVALGACAKPQSVTSQGSVAAQDIRVTTASDEARSHYLAGERLLDVGRPQEANAHFRKAVELDSTFAYGYLGIAQSAASTQEFKANLDAAARHIEGKSEGEKLLLEINRTFLTNNAEQTLELAQKLTQTHPNSPRAWLVLGNAQQALNQHAAARESYQRALALDRNMYAARTALAFSYYTFEPRDLGQAKQHADLAVASAPEEAKSHEFLGDTYRAMNQLEQARDAYAMAVQKDSTLGVARLKMGHINSFLGNYADARTSYDAAVASAKEANKVTFANFRAFTHVHAGDARAALNELAQVERSAVRSGIPEHQVGGARIFTLTNAAIIALHTGMTREAELIINQLKSVVRADAARVGDAAYTRQQEAQLLAWESQLAARKGDFAAATSKAEEHKKLVEGDRNPRRLETYHSLLGLVELRKGNHAAAVEHYRQANLTDPYTRYHLALALEGAGQAEEAKRIFAEVGAYNFNSVGFALVRSDALKRAGMAKTG